MIKNVDHVVEAAQLTRDTAALNAEYNNVATRSLSLSETMAHRFVRQELQRQGEDLKYLESLPRTHRGRWFP